MTTLAHAVVPSSYYAGATSDHCWLLLEYCDAGCVSDAVVKGWFRTSRDPLSGGPDLRAVLTTAAEIASGMAYLHAHDVVHGDLTGGS